MQEKFTLTYLPDSFHQLIDEDSNIEQFLKDVLSTYKEEEENVMVGSLLSYAQNDASGAPEVHDYEIGDIEFDKENLSGSFYTEFMIFYYYGCDKVVQL